MKTDPDRILTVLLAGGKGQRLGALTADRAKPAVPFGGTYRIIDFALSNLVNSHLGKVLVPVQYRSRSLSEHIRRGWNRFFNTSRGEFIEPLPPQQVVDRWYVGTADAVTQSLFAIREEKPEKVLILSGDHIYKMDYRLMIAAHEDSGAKVTVAAVEVPKSEASGFGVLHVDENDAIIKFQEKPKTPEPIPGNPDLCLASMGIYVFDYDVLEKLVVEDANDPKSSHDFGKDILPKLAGREDLFAFRFIDLNKKETKYWRDVGTIDAYYEANMDLIAIDPLLNLYDPDWPIFRRATLASPAKFVFDGQNWPDDRAGFAVDSLVCHGVIVSGSRVYRSILSPGVRTHSWSLVEDSILFGNVNIGRHAKIRRAIIDKDVEIPEGEEIGYDLEKDRKRFFVTESGTVVIGKRMVVKPTKSA
jgi:glucose-1-phosphate adenylyltransferase